MDSHIVIGQDAHGADVRVDMEELLATRLLVQGNSGSGKSHLLRRLLEESAGMVQQIIIDPEGDFASLSDHFGHVVIDASAHSAAEIVALAARVREHRASVVLGLDGLDVELQIRCSAQFLNALFDAPREHWFPALVVVDEAQMFAPSASGEMAEDTRRLSLGAMTNLMCRGRKRGLAGIVATQRLAKLAKNVAAEASNFLMGRTFLDIDMQRAADLLGMERRQAEQIRDLERGRFLGLGPAITRRPVAIRIGPVKSGSRVNASALVPLPSAAPEEMEALLHKELDKAVPPPPPPPPPRQDPEELARRMQPAAQPRAVSGGPAAPAATPAASDAMLDEILADLASDAAITFQPAASQFQSFMMACRRRGATAALLDMAAFRRRFAVAVAGLDRLDEVMRERVLDLGTQVDDDLLAPFLLIARSAAQGMESPDEEELSRAYGTSSPGRIRRLLEHLERKGLIVTRENYGGGRTINVPGLELA
ncbi:ATP-binding protein [Croceicoccus marinus]|uniref:ATP-binding protein n=1 Tax=Croceicoccus marinus TaxID=450378 RepID=A0A1Z1F988_9SPHN|nr:ATP-binding protein [Croceicoccus marinus]